MQAVKSITLTSCKWLFRHECDVASHARCSLQVLVSNAVHEAHLAGAQGRQAQGALGRLGAEGQGWLWRQQGPARLQARCVRWQLAAQQGLLLERAQELCLLPHTTVSCSEGVDPQACVYESPPLASVHNLLGQLCLPGQPVVLIALARGVGPQLGLPQQRLA